ncbi:MAG TPA: glycoside hydrolase family protein [Stellaceae bacterium]|jgi:muramidase (phage lysozyme)|nr:glycoside hydrolase family protein [Stellaceae bacterium]
MGLLDFLTGGDNSAPDPKTSSDATGSYLGNLIDPTTTPQYLKARQQEFGLNFFANMAAASGPSRLPVPFGSVIGAATLGGEKGLSDLSSQTLQAAQTANQIQDNQLKKLQGAGLLQKMQFINQEMNGGNGTPAGGVAGGVAGVPGSAAGMPAAPGAKPALSSTTADTSLLPEQRALLDTIAGPESSGAYNIRWNGPNGGAYFDSYAQHPNIAVAGPAGPSTAAGRYQFVNSTWQPIADTLGLKDFSPENQDKAAWYNASTVYQQKTGRDLLADLKAGKTQDVASALRGQWATLAGAMPAYSANLAKYNSPAVASAAPGSVTVPTAGLLGKAANMPPGAPASGSTGPAQAAPSAGDSRGGITVDGNWYPNTKAWNIAMDARSASVGPNMKGDPGVIVGGKWQPTPAGGLTASGQQPTPAGAAPGATSPAAAPQGGSVPAPRGPIGLLAAAAPGAVQGAPQTPTAAPAGLMAAAAQGGPPAPVAPPQAPQMPPMPSAPPPVMTAQAGAPMTPQQIQPAQVGPMSPQAQMMPPGVTPQAIADAARRVRVYNLMGMTPPPDLVKLSTYPLEAALAAQNAQSSQAAEAAFAGPKAGAVASAQAPYDMVDVVVNGQQMKMPKDQYMRIMQGYGQQAQAGPGPGSPAGGVAQPGASPGMPQPGQTAGGMSVGTPYINPLYKDNIQPVVASDNKRIAENLVPAADKAQETFQSVALISDLMKQVQTGWGADTKASAAKILSGLGASDENIQKLLGINPTDADALNKTFLLQVSSAVRTMGAREPGSIVSLFAKNFPNLETQPNAIKLLENVFLMQAQQAQDKLGQAQQHQNTQLENLRTNQPYTPLTNMENSFAAGNNKSINYLKAAEAMSYTGSGTNPLAGMSKSDAAAVWNLIPSGTRLVMPGGQTQVKP